MSKYVPPYVINVSFKQGAGIQPNTEVWAQYDNDMYEVRVGISFLGQSRNTEYDCPFNDNFHGNYLSARNLYLDKAIKSLQDQLYKERDMFFAI